MESSSGLPTGLQLVAALLEYDEEEELLAGLLFQARPPGTGVPRRCGGSYLDKKPNRRREYHARHLRLLQQYFGPEPIFNEFPFRRLYRMSKRLFSKISWCALEHDDYFTQKQDATGKLGISSILKLTAALRVLAYSSSFDSIDKNLEMSETVVTECVDQLCDAVIASFADEYMRPPRADEMKRLLELNAKRGFVGMIGSIDCMHWAWKSCPVMLAGQHKGKEKKPTKVLEAVGDYNLRIWHYNFGSPGSLNDINILEQPPIFHAMLRSDALQVPYTVNGTTCHIGWPMESTRSDQYLSRLYSIRLAKTDSIVPSVKKLGEKMWSAVSAYCRLAGESSASHVNYGLLTKSIKGCMRAAIIHNLIVDDEAELYQFDEIQYQQHDTYTLASFR